MISASVTGRNWIFKNFDNEKITYIKENYDLDEITSKLLSIRNIENNQITSFLNPFIKNHMPNPNSIKDMKKTVERLISSIGNKEKIGVFGDYDVDGATSTALICKYLNHLGITNLSYIPDRSSEGYGPSKKGFEYLIRNGCQLIITVDCGTLSFEPIQYAKRKNIDVIVLDHHQSDIKLPEAFSILNPNRLDDESDLKYLCAAGVCFIFLVALNKELREVNWFKKEKIKEPNLLAFLDLVSLGTICDLVPLVGLNRALVKQGLKIFKNKNNLGLKTLLDFCKIDSTITSYHLGYVIGPRINAGGRVGKASHGADLLINENPKQIFKIASELNTFNSQRQDLEKDLYDKVLKKVKLKSNKPALILVGENWHDGVIGIVASKIKEKFNKPTILISLNDEIGKGSARSILGFDIGAKIISGVQQNLLIKGGGHKMAGGFTIDRNKIDDFENFIINHFTKSNLNLNIKKDLYIDSEIIPSAIDNNFYNSVDLLGPFGSGNPAPRFVINDLILINSKVIKEKHIRSIFKSKDNIVIKTISFNVIGNEIGPYLLTKNKFRFNLAGKLSLNEWKGEKNVEFIIDDISVNKIVKNKVPSSIG